MEGWEGRWEGKGGIKKGTTALGGKETNRERKERDGSIRRKYQATRSRIYRDNQRPGMVDERAMNKRERERGRRGRRREEGKGQEEGTKGKGKRNSRPDDPPNNERK